MSNNNIEAIYGLAPMQQGMLFHTLYDPDSADSYFEWLDFPLQLNLNVEAFKLAWQHVLDRHSSLRAAFIWERQGEPLQVIRQKVPLPWAQLDWRGLSPREQKEELRALLLAEQEQGFELARAPLMRLTLIRLGEHSYQLVWCNHHLLFDGWSRVLIINEVFALYRSYARGESAQLPPALPYRDYINWLQRQDSADAEAFWRRTLAGFDEPTPLPLAVPAREHHDKQDLYGRARVYLSAETTAALGEMARAQQVTLNTVVQGAWALLLSRYAGRGDVLFGAVVSGRPADLPGVESMVGLFINTLPVRARLTESEPAGAWLRRLQSEQAEARQYEHSPLVQVQAWGETPRGSQLFESVLVFENYPVDASLRDGEPEPEAESSLFVEKSNYPLTVLAIPGRQLTLQLSYDRRRFDEAAVVKVLGHLRNIVEGMAANADAPLSSLPMLGEEERRQLLREWNDTARDYPRDLCVHQLFEQQAAATPDATALSHGGGSMTYGELNGRANRLARHLRARGVGPESRVGLMCERSPEMVVSLLAILKAGGAYVPLDPAYPRERLSFMIEDAGVEVLLTREESRGLLPVADIRVVCLDAERDEIARHGAEDLTPTTAPDNLAYVTYTSGSTGRPKGVMVNHRAVARLVRGADYVGFAPDDCFLLFAPLAFDASTFELWGSLLNGARLAVMEAGQPSLEELGRAIREYGVTTLWLTSGLFHLMVDEQLEDLAGLRYLLTGGDVVSPAHARRFVAASAGWVLVVCYGPTENTTFTTTHPVGVAEEFDNSLPIGRPIANTRVYILDGSLRPVPAGVPGELYTAGDGLARGYLDRPALTAERFIPDPFAAEPGARLYRTGDLCRYRADGAVEFIGRIDQQVKVRGFRIELGEIEAALSACPQVKESAAVVAGAGVEKRIVAYVVESEAGSVVAADLRARLKERLPEYMMPSAFVVLGALPLTANGKVDRKALPEPDYAHPELLDTYVPPSNSVEEQLAEVWAEVLRVERVGAHDNFFELGGDSILSIQVIARAARRGIRLTPKLLFQHQTVSQLAAAASSAAPAPGAEQGAVSGPAPLTPIQRWFFAAGYANPHRFNQAVLLEARRGLDAGALGSAARHLVRHHDALRLRFAQAEGGRWLQEVAQAEEHRIFSHVTLAAASEAELEAEFEAEADRLQGSLHLSRGPLLRIALFDLGAGRPQRLLVVAHHLVVDGVSWRVLLEDLRAAYEQAEAGGALRLPAKTTSFKRWAELMADYARSPALREELGYWREQAESARRQRLPVDYEGGENTEGAAGHVTTRLSEELTRALLQEVPAAYHTQINDALVTAAARAFRRWTGSAQLVLEMEGHGREELFDGADTTRTVGWFTAAYPLRVTLGSGEHGVGEELKMVKETLRGVPGRGVGYGVLRHMGGEGGEGLEELEAEPGVSFNYLGQFDQVLGEDGPWGAGAGRGGAVRDAGERRARLLDINGSVSGGRLEMSWTYGTRVHRRETIERLAGYFAEEAEAIVRHCREAGAGGYTPSDFPLARLDKEKLDRVAMLLGEADESDESELAAVN